MTQQQIILADKILRLMITEHRVWSRDAFGEKVMQAKQCSLNDFIYVMERLATDGFIEFHLYSKRDYIITYKGEKAAKIGLEKYYREIEVMTEINERRAKNSYLLLIISVVLSTIGLIISLIAILRQAH